MTERNQPEVDRAEISAMRRSYGEVGITESSINSDPISQFQIWLKEAATNSMIVEANAMVLSTVGSGKPTSRTVLLKDVTSHGFTFFTNYESRKSQEISKNSAVSLLFPWYPMERQVIVLGEASRISDDESEKYFATRPWSSQIGAWASSQSEVLESREMLEAQWKMFAEVAIHAYMIACDSQKMKATQKLIGSSNASSHRLTQLCQISRFPII